MGSVGTRLGKCLNWECLFVNRARGLFLSLYKWKTFLDHVSLGCTQSECQISKDIVDNYRSMFESRIFAGTTEKRPETKATWKSDAETTSSASYDMECHAKKCMDRYCQLANETIQQLHNVATPCMDDHQFQEEEHESVGELSTVCSQIVLECLYLSRIGRPDILWSEPTCSCGNKVDKSLWQTFGTFDPIYSLYTWIQTILQCWKHSTTMQIRIVSRFWFCTRPWRLKINIRRTLVQFRKSNICVKKLDVQETDISLTQFYRSRSHFTRCRFRHGWDSRSRFFGFSDWGLSFLTKPNQQNQR